MIDPGVLAILLLHPWLQLTSDMFENLYDYAKLLFDCGNYQYAEQFLSQYYVLVRTHVLKTLA